MCKLKLYYFWGHDVTFHCFAESLEQAVSLAADKYANWFVEILSVTEYIIPEQAILVNDFDESHGVDCLKQFKEIAQLD